MVAEVAKLPFKPEELSPWCVSNITAASLLVMLRIDTITPLS
jgi:hypothetical protein